MEKEKKIYSFAQNLKIYPYFGNGMLKKSQLSQQERNEKFGSDTDATHIKENIFTSTTIKVYTLSHARKCGDVEGQIRQL